MVRARRRRGLSGSSTRALRGIGKLGLLVVIVLAAVAWWQLSRSATDAGSTGDSTADSAGQSTPSSAIVERVIDGDTIVVTVASESTRVRLLNIDTPESVAPGRPVECLGPEASAFLDALLPAGTEVQLEFDRDLRDRYDRMLAGVFTNDGEFVNAVIARAGYAESVVFAPNDRFADQIDAAVAEAQRAEVGLWSDPALC